MTTAASPARVGFVEGDVSPSSSPMLARRLQRRGFLAHGNSAFDASVNGGGDVRGSPATATATDAAGAASRVWNENASPLLPAGLSYYAPPPEAVPVELQVETMSSRSSRVFLYLWYAVLIAALIVESNVQLQWSSRNFCGAAAEVSAYHVEQWNSSACLSWEAYWVRTEDAAVTAARQRHTMGSSSRSSKGADASRYGLVAWPPPDAVRDAQSRGGACAATKYTASAATPHVLSSQVLRASATPSSAFAPCPEATTSPDTSAAARRLSSDSASAPTAHPSPSPRPTMPPLRRAYKLRWTAEALSGVLDHQLNRFLHVFISLASPLAAAATPPMPGADQRVYDVLVALEEISVMPDTNTSSSSTSSLSSSSSSSHGSDGQNASQYTYTYRASVTCWRDRPRCGNIILPSSVVIPGNSSRLTVTLIDVDAELAEANVHGALVGARGAVGLTEDEVWGAAADFAAPGVSSRAATLASGVGVMYQRANYTLGTLIFRYVFLLVTLVSVLRFLYRGRYAQRLRYEQRWTLAAQVGLLFYLNPLYWWCIYAGGSTRRGGREAPTLVHRVFRLVLYYVEFHVPTYFVALIVCYIWSVIAGSFRWQSPAYAVDADASTAEASMEGRAVEAGASSVPSSRLARSRARVLRTAFLVTVTVLDVAHCVFEEEGVGGTELTCSSATCLRLSAGIGYLLLFGILSSGVGLYWLRRNLACHPYLSTRPQQLACRIMIFMYFTGGIYSVVQVALLDALYAQLLGVIYYQPLIQLSHVLVLNSLVNHMTYVYTTTQPSLQIPLRPNDPQWKRVGWSTRWYRWLDWHGGSLYVFFSEAEERLFYEVQVAYQLAKHKRKQAKAQAKLEKKAAKKARSRRSKAARDAAGAGDEAARMARSGVSRTVLSWLEGRGSGGVPGTDAASGHGAQESDAAGSSRQRSTSAGAAGPPPAGRGAGTNSNAVPSPTEEALQRPLGTDGRRRTLSTITTHPSTSSSDRLAVMTHDSADDEEGRGDEASAVKADRQEKSESEAAERVRDAGVTPPCSAERRAPSAMPHVNGGAHGEGIRCVERDDTSLVPGRDGISGGGPEVGELPALPQPLVSHDGVPVDPAVLAGFSFLVSQSHEQQGSRGALSRVSSRMLDALHGAEHRLVNGTATFIDFLAETCVDRPLRVLLRQRARQHFVFFNLETAIDCLNLSCEAYAVQESRGDEFIRTGFQVDATEVPRAALGFVERVAVTLLGLCFKPSPHHEPLSEHDAEGEGGSSSGGAAPDTDTIATEAVSATEGEEDEAAPLLRPSRHPTLATTPPPPSPQQRASPIPAAGTASSAPAPTQGTPQRAGSWRRFFGSPDRAAAVVAGGPSDAEAASTAAGATSPAPPPGADRLPPMNVEQYGYHRIAVLETRGVQVVVARMDVSGACPVHVGKTPRLVIAFRGTDNVANAMEDMRFRQRTWKEMETPTLSTRAAVHSGFLELWMSLKERVMDVVLAELRRQCVDAGEARSAGEAGDNAAAEAGGAGASPTRVEHDKFRTSVPFTSLWTLPAHQRGSADTQLGRSHGESGGGFLRIYVTGHSLGGALASLCAYTLRRMLLLIRYPEPDLVVYTFGQPRIGNSVFKQYYNRAIPCTFRVVNESDAVSGFNFFGGHHVGVQVNVDRHGNYICKPMYIERMFRPTRGRGFALTNHTIAAYASSLNAMADVYAHGACPLRCRRPYVDDIESVSSTESDEDESGSSARRSRSGAAKAIDGRRPTASAPSAWSLLQREEREAAAEDGVAGDVRDA